MGRRPRVHRSSEEKFAIVMKGLKSGKVSESCRKHEIGPASLPPAHVCPPQRTDRKVRPSRRGQPRDSWTRWNVGLRQGQQGDIARRRGVFFVEHIIGSAEAGRGRNTGRGVDPQSDDQRADVLPLEETIRWAGSRSGAADEASASAEYAHEATGGRTELGRDDVAGRAPK